MLSKTNKTSSLKKKNRGSNKSSRTFTAPVAVGTRIQRTAPRMVSTPKGVVVTHREYISDIVSLNANFNTFSIPINPGLETSFPWLSGIARRFEQYRFKRICFEIETCASTATIGSIGLAFDPDCKDALPTTKAGFLSEDRSVRGPPWQSLSLPYESARYPHLSLTRYIRSSTLPNVDLHLYDVGNMIYYLHSLPAAVTIVGELFISYEIELITPATTTDAVIQENGTIMSVASSALAWFGGAVVSDGARLPGEITSSSRFTFNQKWSGFLICRMTGSGFTTTNMDFHLASSSGVTQRTLLPQVINSTQTETVAGIWISVISGDTITPTVTAAGITLFRLTFSENDGSLGSF